MTRTSCGARGGGVRRRTTRARWRRSTAALICAALVATGCTPGDDDEPGKAGTVDSAAVEAVAKGLPDDPAQAAEQLVADILSDDADRSAAATAELLRRSGHAIVSAKGPVVAVPDQLAMVDAPVYAELVPLLARATRAGDRYSVEEFATLLTSVGLTEKDPTFAQLTAAIGNWAKEPGDNPVFVTAAAGVRALAAHRQQVFFPGADPASVFLDPLQTTLLLGHATSRFGEVKPGAKPQALGRPGLVDRLLGGGVAHADPAGPCGEFAAIFASPGDAAGKAHADFLKGELKDRLSKEFLTEGGKEAFDKANEAWGKAGAAASAILLMLGARLDLTADKSSTHFKHRAGTRDEHVTLTATALFDAGIALDKLECYALAGVDVPKPGPMKGMTIKWASEQPLLGGYQEGGNQLLKAVSADSAKFTRGSKTGDDGKATVELKPPVEDPAGEGEELKGKALFIAKLDKESFPFELGDAYGFLSNAVGFGIGKTFDLLKEVLVKAGLPAQTITIEVKYHGADIILAQGSSEVNLLLAKLMDVHVDLVSCTGVAGPFKGTAGYAGAESSGMLQAAGAVTGVNVPKGFAGQDNEISVMTNDREGPNPFFIMKGEGGAQFLDGVLRFYPFLSTRFEVLADYRVGRPVGEVEILLGGSSFPFSDLSWPIVRVQEDPRCPKVKYSYDGL
ncbi:hypothetical protein [Polymorphospora lycopeni]|uniref:Lipoprotein n=1 Tax=Polymorphospora lycopeni TaxID=3140240 RepID=A0ABV5CRV6_9ACTN